MRRCHGTTSSTKTADMPSTAASMTTSTRSGQQQQDHSQSSSRVSTVPLPRVQFTISPCARDCHSESQTGPYCVQYIATRPYTTVSGRTVRSSNSSPRFIILGLILVQYTVHASSPGRLVRPLLCTVLPRCRYDIL